MLNVKSLVGAVALAVAGTAGATDVTVGDLSNKIVPIGVSHSAADTSFIDNYEFTITGTGSVLGLVFSFPLDINPNLPGVEFDINLIGLALTDSNGTVLSSDTDTSNGLAIFAPVTSGTYKVSVFGGTTGTLGGSYNGYLASSVTAVPEPETYALMLAGLGAVGFMARRRKNG